jgi:short subunit dehydrogenase-like uncharacterized protein
MSDHHPPGDRDHDLVLFGATGFVGRLTAEHLAATAPDGLRVALAGRSSDKLAALRDELGPAAAGWALEVADAGDPDEMAGLAARSRVIATSVGPYLRYGTPLVEACARSGTHYADLTGEVLFIRRTADRLHDLAASTGARIVHACGFDSVPSDLGVALLHERAQAEGSGELTTTTLLVRSLKGGASGGTLASMRGMVEEVRRDPEARRLLTDPYALSPDRTAEPSAPQPDQWRPRRDPHLGVWTAPFFMASFNTRVVRRSNALQGWSYGKAFRYHETMGVGRGPAAPLLATGISAGLGIGMAGMALGPRRLLDRVLPSPGEGPGEEARRNGRFRFDTTADTTGGNRYRAIVAAQGDPGYAATAVMFGQSALALALDGDALPDAAGVLTPSRCGCASRASRSRSHGPDGGSPQRSVASQVLKGSSSVAHSARARSTPSRSVAMTAT